MKNTENNDNIDYKNLTKEELISIILESKNKLDSIVKEKDKIIEDKELEIKNLKKLVEKLKIQIAKNNVERFSTKDDNAFRTKKERREISRTKIEDKKNESEKKGRISGSKNYSKEDLELLSKDNDVIINDNIDELKEKHPGWEFITLNNMDDVSYIIEREKVKIKVFKVITPKYIAKDKLTNKKVDGIYQAPSKSIINHSYAGASLLADLCTMKYHFGLPLYRYSKWLDNCGFHVDERTLYNWSMNVSFLLEGVYNQIEKELIEGDCNCIGVDETVLKVIDNIKDNRESNYVYLLSSKHDDKEFHYYKYTKTRNSEWIKDYLKNYKGSIIVDGYTGYKNLSGQISKQRCYAHLRRKLTDIVKTLKKEQRNKSTAYRLVKELDEIFHMENEIKKQTKDPLEILKLRNTTEYQDKVKIFNEDITSINAADGTKLKEAIDYYLNDFDAFMTFNDNGYVPITNNETERLAKDFATNRRAFLFCKSDEGAKSCAILTTLAKTAIANDLYIDSYFEYVLKHIQDTPVEKLTPWALKDIEELKMKIN